MNSFLYHQMGSRPITANCYKKVCIKISRLRQRIENLQIERFELLLDYQENGKWIRELDEMLSLFRYIKKGHHFADLHKKHLSMSYRRMHQEVNDYKFPLEILKRYPAIKRKARIGDDGQFIKNPSERMDGQLVVA